MGERAAANQATEPQRGEVLSRQIAHTGGVGVAVRSTCVPEARTTPVI